MADRCVDPGVKVHIEKGQARGWLLATPSCTFKLQGHRIGNNIVSTGFSRSRLSLLPLAVLVFWFSRSLTLAIMVFGLSRIILHSLGFILSYMLCGDCNVQ